MITTSETLTITARWASRRPAWGDYYCLSYQLPDGRVWAIGTPTKEQCLAEAQRTAAERSGRPVHRAIGTPRAR